MEWSQLLSDRRQRDNIDKVTNDNRSEFQKDYHRIVGSASFRRLQDKTQVFPLDKSDFIRTRLTHSLEVSSLAKSIGQSVCNKLVELNMDAKVISARASDISDILLCAGLIHDIGNPPFGHYGESVIQEWFKKNLDELKYDGRKLKDIFNEQMLEDLYNFEGNAQAIRIVTKLHNLVDENGMNLTKALLNTIVKYPVPSHRINMESGNVIEKKMGYFYADSEVFNAIVQDTGANKFRHPLTFLLEAADDIAYRTADIEDAFKKGLITYEQIIDALKDEKYSEFKDDDNYKGVDLALYELEKLHTRAVVNGINNPKLYAVQNWIIKLQGMLINYVTASFINNYVSIMNGTYLSDLFKDTYAHYLVEMLFDISVKYVFDSKEIVKLEIAANTIIEFLLDKFTRAVIYFDTDKAEKLSIMDMKLIYLISDNYINVYKYYSIDKSEAEKLYLRMILVTDFISGMTDQYAKTLYQELNGIY